MNKQNITWRATVLAAILSLGFGASACTSTNTLGKQFDALKSSQIVKGKTTQEEVLALMGPPLKKVPTGVKIAGLPQGCETWFWWRQEVKQHQTLSVGGTAAFLLLPTFLTPDPNIMLKTTGTEGGFSQKLWVTYALGGVVNGMKVENQNFPASKPSN